MSWRRIEHINMLITWGLRIGLLLVMIVWFFIGRISLGIIFQFLLGFLIIEMPWSSIYRASQGSEGHACSSIDPAKDGQKLVSATDLEPVVEACIKPSAEVAEDPQPSDVAAEASPALKHPE